MNAYALLKLVHVVSVIVWIGGALNKSLLTWRMGRAADRAAYASFARHAAFVGPGIIGPASLVVLLTGIGMIVVADINPGAPWISWGFGGVVVHFLFGPFLLRRAGMRFGQAMTAGDDAQLAVARRRLGWLNVAYLLLLFSVVAAMVVKPT